MRRIAFILLILSLAALGCDAGALCAAVQATQAECCCPMSLDGTSPCMEESDQPPVPADQQATLDAQAQHWDLARPVAAPLPQPTRRVAVAHSDHGAAAGQGPALYLLACSFRN